MHWAAGIPASVYRMPGLGPGVRTAAPSCRAIAVEHDRGTAARIRRGRIGEDRGGWTLYCAVIALTAYRRRRVVLHHDGLIHWAAGVAAHAYGLPALVSVVCRVAPSCRA